MIIFHQFSSSLGVKWCTIVKYTPFSLLRWILRKNPSTIIKTNHILWIFCMYNMFITIIKLIILDIIVDFSGNLEGNGASHIHWSIMKNKLFSTKSDYQHTKDAMKRSPRYQWWSDNAAIKQNKQLKRY